LVFVVVVGGTAAGFGKEIGDVVRTPELERDDVIDLDRASIWASLHAVLALDRVLLAPRDVANRARAKPPVAEDLLREAARVRAGRAATVGFSPSLAAARCGSRAKQDDSTSGDRVRSK